MLRRLRVLWLAALLVVSAAGLAFAKDTFIKWKDVNFISEITFNGDWQTCTLTVDKKYSIQNLKFEPGGPEGGLKAWSDSDWISRMNWHVGSSAERIMHHWEFRATIERLDEGGSGLMFGKSDMNKGNFIAVYLIDDKLVLLSFDTTRPGRNNRANSKVLHEANLKPEHQKPGNVALHVSIDRADRALRCSVNDTEYLNLNLSTQLKEMPSIEDYGFYNGSWFRTQEANAIYKKIETRRSK
ncbi:MAG: hypothetical protein LBJ36_05730 [Synergistaceae bacterium]|jgi:hypothetical protein|nr:hypothetical protein [Synergistaceae bacterium]